MIYKIREFVDRREVRSSIMLDLSNVVHEMLSINILLKVFSFSYLSGGNAKWSKCHFWRKWVNIEKVFYFKIHLRKVACVVIETMSFILNSTRVSISCKFICELSDHFLPVLQKRGAMALRSLGTSTTHLLLLLVFELSGVFYSSFLMNNFCK